MPHHWHVLTRIKPKQQYKQRVCTDKMIQNKNGEAATKNVTKATKTMMIKQAIKDVRWTSRRELTDKSSTRLCYPYGYSQLSYWQGQAPSS